MRVTMCAVAAVALLGDPDAAFASATVSAGSLSATVGEDPWSLSFVHPDGRSILEEHPGTGPGPTGTLGFRAAGVWRHATRVVSQRREGAAFVAELATTDPLRRMEVRIAPDDEGVIALEASVIGPREDVSALGIGFEQQAGERYLGFGERSNAVDQRGTEVENYVGEGVYPVEERPFIAGIAEPWAYQPRDDATYFPVPWLLSTSGYGVLVDNVETSYFRLGTEAADGWSLEVTNAPPNQVQGASAPAPAKLSLRVFGGPTPAEALRRFTAATGRQPPPAAPWYLGPWFQPVGGNVPRANELRAADAPISVAQTYTRYLPCGVHEGITNVERGRTRDMHARGLAITTYLNPMVCKSYTEPYSQAAAGDGLTRVEATGEPYVYRYPTAAFFAPEGDLRYLEVSQFDFSSAAGRSVFDSVMTDAVDNGYDGWMEDYGEYTPLDSQSADGREPTETHNLYPVQYHCQAQDFAERQERPLGRFIRSGFTGVAPCAQIVWGGDPTTAWGFDGLESAVTNGLTIGLSGISLWGSDIGGLFANGLNRLTPELKIRWIQFGLASGIMRDQAGQFAVPDTAEKARPQIWEPEILPHWRRYAKLRTQLYPYLVAADAEYQRSGLPIMRHFALAYPDDPQAAGEDRSFLFGPDLLAAPVVAPDARERETYVPRGEWVDLWRSVSYESESGGLSLERAEVLAGGRSTTLPAPLEELPLLARAGTILPLLPPDVDTLADYGASEGLVKLSDRDDQLELLAFPRGDTSASFYDEERLVSRESANRWTLEVRGSTERDYRLQASLATLRGELTPCAVTLDGRPLSADDWSYDSDDEVLTAGFRTDSGELAVSGCGRPDAGAGPGGGGGQGGGTGGGGGAGSGDGGSGEAARCFRAATSARGNRVGRAGLARRRSSVRRTFGASGRYRRFVDRYCLRDGGAVRVAYPSRRELRGLSRSERRRVRGESIFVLTTSRSLRIRGVRRGMGRRAMLRRVGRQRGVRVGRNVWYFRKGRNSRHIFKVRGGRVREMGIADARLTESRARAERFFRQGR
jgi:alpha-glucosidase (family GH31 glycosyl hydrolase)